MRAARNIAIVLAIALAISVLPGGGPALSVAFTLLTIVFLTSIGMLGYRMYRENRLFFDALAQDDRAQLYGSIALAILTFADTDRLFSYGGVGYLAWFALIGLSVMIAISVVTRAQRYG